MSLDVRRLRLLREVDLRGTIAAAADALNFTPSAVSQQLSALEREAGVELLERNGRRVRLTEAGRMLVSHTESVLVELERAEAAMEATRTTVMGTVRVAAFPSVTGAVLAPAFAALAGRHPRLIVTLAEAEPAAARRDVKLGELDVAVVHEYDHKRQPAELNLEQSELFVEDMLLAVPEGLVPPGRKLRLGDLRDQAWITAPPWGECGMAEREACRLAGFDPDVRYSSNEFGVILTLVAAGLGVSLLPALAFAAEPRGWQVHQMAGPALRRRVFATYRPGSRARPSLVAVLDAIRDAADAHTAQADHSLVCARRSSSTLTS